MIAITTAVDKIARLSKKYRIIKGGTYAGKTYCILLILIQIALQEKRKRITVVAETIPAVKQGAMLLFENIMNELLLFSENSMNRSERKYTFPSGSTIQFTAYDTPGKAKAAGKHDYIFLNEANHIQWSIVNELLIRCDVAAYTDFNPTGEFWLHEHLANDNQVEILTLTYRDNESLTVAKIAELEAKRVLAKTSKYWANWCRVYLDGEEGELQDVCVTGWQLIDNIPAEARLIRHGLDFGYTNESAGISIYRYNDAIIADEWLYQTNLNMNELISKCKSIHPAPIVCDKASPLIITELKRAGITAVPCIKGDGSVEYGIGKLNQIKLLITSRSLNLIKELRNYIRIDGIPTGSDHAIDALRYAVTYEVKSTPVKSIIFKQTEIKL